MRFSEFIALSSKLLFNPFRVLDEVNEIFKTESRRKFLTYSLLTSLMGNGALIVTKMVMEGFVRAPGVLILDLIIPLFFIYLSGIVCIAVYYFFIYLARENGHEIDLGRLIGLYFFTDLIYIILIPVAIVSRAFIQTDSFYVLFSFVIIIMNILLKIRSIGMVLNLSKGKSVALYLLPAGILILVTAGGLVYITLTISRLFSL